ncbi:potassium transporter [Oceaniferula spumae]|uniref:Potassium transporter n=1 Tax=Oceaniferula spumae TaxID=2979115 RepID=A0AAT9FPW3_9BACT
MKHIPLLSTLLGLLLVVLPTAHAQTVSPTSENVEKRLKSLEAEGTDKGNNPRKIELLKEIKLTLDETKASEQTRLRYEEEIKSAPKLLNQLNQQIEQSKSAEAPEVTAETETSEIDNKKAAIAAELEVAKTEASELSAEETERNTRKTAIPQLLANARVQLQKIDPVSPTGEAANEISNLEFQLQLSKKASLQAQLAELATEQRYYQQTAEVFAAKKRLAAINTTRLETLNQQWHKIYQQRHALETAESKQKAQQQAARFEHIPALAKITKKTSELVELRSKILRDTRKVRTQEADITSHRKEIEKQRRSAQERLRLLEDTGIRIDSESAGLLRRQRAKLPTKKSLQNSLEENVRKVTKAQIQLLEAKDLRETLPFDNKKETAELLKTIKDPKVTEADISSLLENRNTALNNLIKESDSYISALRSLSVSTQQAIEEVDTYSQYLDKRLLWIPSAEKFALSDIATEWTAVKHLIAHDLGWTWRNHLITDFREHWLIWTIFLLTLAALIYRRRRYRKILVETSELSTHRSCTSIRPTFKALGITLLLALPAPLTFAFLSWRVSEPVNIHLGLLACAFFFLLFGTLRHLARRNGIFRSHFLISEEKSAHLFKHLTWFMYLMPLFTILSFILSRDSIIPHVGRVSFFLGMIVLVLFLHCLLRPGKKMLAQKNGPRWRSNLIYAIVLSLPAIFILGAGYGYIISIHKIRGNIMLSVWFTLLVVFIVRLLMRWILVSRRRLARDHANKKYKAILAKENEDSEETKNHPSLEELEASAINPVAIEEQTKKLVKVGAIAVIIFGYLGIWSSTLPALSVLDDVKMWPSKQAATESTESKSPSPDLVKTLSSPNKSSSDSSTKESATEPSEKDSQKSGGFSLKDLLVTIIIIFLMIVAAKNIPGLLELSLLRRLDLRPGGNYAITTVLRYAIIAIGCLLAFSRIGITWSSVQWLAAAVTLGIGFGLQEIFANFVAGIILLFERPIRLGDIVTVGQVSGKVTQIQIRATTILQFNNRELLVPNKEFITGQLVNWTLRDSVLRFELPVGIAYGSDTEKASEILLKIAEEHKDVMDDPKPEVLFTAFGNSTLDFTLRAFVATPDLLIRVQSALHYQIDHAFREAEIEIAFPQTDIHIRSLPSEMLTEKLSSEAKETLAEEDKPSDEKG